MRKLIAVLAFILMIGQAFAQELKPLVDVIETAARPYTFNRCSGLYQATMEWGGQERLGEDTFSTMDTALKAMLAAGVYSAQADGMGGTAEHIIEMTLRDTRNIADLYLQRFEKNYAVQGEAFGSDDVVMGDIALCKEIAQIAVDAGF